MVECELIRHGFLIRRDKGFNRYMVECELIRHGFLIRRDKGFNRYMVECEYATNKLGIGADAVLIDTWWNVN